MVVADEAFVVTEHQQQVQSPQHHVEFHERHDARVACHGLGSDDLAAAAEHHFLYPRDEVAAVLGAEDVHRHHHHPQSE